MQIRLGNKQDEAAVRAFVAAIDEEQGLGLPDFGGAYADLRNIEGNYIGHDGCFFVAEQEKRFYAFAGARSRTEDVCELKRLYIDRDERTSDLPSSLLETVVNFCRRIGYLSLAVTAPAPYLVKILETGGFVANNDGKEFQLTL